MAISQLNGRVKFDDGSCRLYHTSIMIYIFTYDLTVTMTWLWLTIKIWLLGAKVSYRCRCWKVFAQWFNKLCLTKVYISWSTSVPNNTKKSGKNVTCSINESMVFLTRTTCRLFTTSADGWVYYNCPLARPGGKSARMRCWVSTVSPSIFGDASWILKYFTNFTDILRIFWS